MFSSFICLNAYHIYMVQNWIMERDTKKQSLSPQLFTSWLPSQRQPLLPPRGNTVTNLFLTHLFQRYSMYLEIEGYRFSKTKWQHHSFCTLFLHSRISLSFHLCKAQVKNVWEQALTATTHMEAHSLRTPLLPSCSMPEADSKCLNAQSSSLVKQHSPQGTVTK